MAGLDMVKGPHWSQILQLFGPNGTISDILKDRNQVQLKDKARNLKLFFLKTNSEMPYYLQHVTGELKTRAPSQAARKEAEERARLTTEDEQARVQGIMTLAGGLQNSVPRPQNGAAPRPPVQSMVPRPAAASSALPQAQVAGVRAGPPPGNQHPQSAPRPVQGAQNNLPMPQQAGVRAGVATASVPTSSTAPKQLPAQSQPPQGLAPQQPPRVSALQAQAQLARSPASPPQQQNGAVGQQPALAASAAAPAVTNTPAMQQHPTSTSDASLLQPLKAAAAATLPS